MMDRRESAAVDQIFGSVGWEMDGSAPPPEISSMTVRKAYVERRSWLHPLRSFWRIHSFLLVVLHMMIVAAFTTTRSGLVWDGALLEGLCSTILTHSACGLIAELLALFHDHGLLHTHPARLAGLLLRLTYKAAMAAALALSYARLVKAYPIDAQRGVDAFEWAADVLPSHSFGIAAAIYMVPASLSTLSQIFPAISSWVRGWRGAPKAAVDLLEPLNRLYVGRPRPRARAAAHAPTAHGCGL